MIAMQTPLNQIATRWTLVNRAHSAGALAVFARHELVERYCGAAWRYLRAVTHDDAIAEDLFQEFALRLIRGDCHRAAAGAGRFRDYLKAVLINLVKDHFRRRQQHPLLRPDQLPDLGTDAALDSESHDAFLESWRDELLDRAWTALQESHAALHLVLRVHASQPEATAGEKADYLSRLSGEPFNANRFRVMLHRAREKFSGHLKREVAVSLGEPTEEELQSELHRLRLLRYCGY
jgi:RNA polymerase sigma-70 factor (ECF subfamily)